MLDQVLLRTEEKLVASGTLDTTAVAGLVRALNADRLRSVEDLRSTLEESAAGANGPGS